MFSKYRPEKKIIVEYPIVEIGAPNRHGNFYTRIGVEKMLELFSVIGSLSGIYVTLGNHNRPEKKESRYEFTHKIINLFKEGDFLVAVIEFNDLDAYKIFSAGLAIFKPTIRGNILEDGEIKVVDLISIDLIHLDERMIPTETVWEKIKKPIS